VLLALVLTATTVIGQPAPEWPGLRWVQGGPLSLSGLRGKVVLVRFFTDPACPYCSATAPALNELHEELGPDGLVVVGFYTPKPSPRPTTVERVRRVAQRYGFRFPVAVDDEWRALRRLWLDRENSGWTSASLLMRDLLAALGELHRRRRSIDIGPEVCRLLQRGIVSRALEPQRRVGGHPSLAPHEFVEAHGRDPQRLGRRGLSHLDRLQELVDLAGEELRLVDERHVPGLRQHDELRVLDLRLHVARQLRVALVVVADDHADTRDLYAEVLALIRA